MLNYSPSNASMSFEAKTMCEIENHKRVTVERLVRAAWRAGFLAGHESGGDAATAYEWGGKSIMPQTPDKAWKEDVEWQLKNNDIESIQFWKNMP